MTSLLASLVFSLECLVRLAATCAAHRGYHSPALRALCVVAPLAHRRVHAGLHQGTLLDLLVVVQSSSGAACLRL